MDKWLGFGLQVWGHNASLLQMMRQLPMTCKNHLLHGLSISNATLSYSVAQAAEKYQCGKYGLQRIFLLFKKPADVLKFIQAGGNLESLNVGI